MSDGGDVGHAFEHPGVRTGEAGEDHGYARPMIRDAPVDFGLGVAPAVGELSLAFAYPFHQPLGHDLLLGHVVELVFD